MGPGYNYAWAASQLGGRTTREILCPDCSASRKAGNRKKPCLGLRNLGDGRITYKCQNCSVDGVFTEGWQDGPKQRWPTATVVPLKQPLHDDHDDGMSEWAAKIWDGAQGSEGTIIEDYWHARFGPGVPIPRTVRLHPRLRHDGKSYPCLLTAYGIQAPKHVTSVHRIFLKPDGSWHTGVKMAAGKHASQPMVVHRNAESRALVIGEGLEKTVAAAFVMNCDGWAAGGLTFMPKLAHVVGDDVECVTIIVDQGDDATAVAIVMATHLIERGIEYRAVRLPADPDVILKQEGADRLRAMLDDPSYQLRVEPTATVKGPRLLSEGEALRLRQPQDWLIEGIVERGYLYALTARSGSGKTAFALLVSYLIGAADIFPRLLGTREVERGNVVYLAGENPIDTIRRMAGLRGFYKLAEPAAVSIVLGRFSIRDSVDVLAEQIPKDRPLSLVCVDTSAFFFEGEEENSNSAMIAHAGALRKLTSLPGNPAVIVLCHPSKFAKDNDELLPRGGSSFYNEIDANLTLAPADGDAVFTLGHTKLRGPDFEAMKVELVRYTDDSFIDTKGRPSSTVVAKVLTEQEADTAADVASANERKVIEAIEYAANGLKLIQIVEVTGMLKGTAYKIVGRLVQRRLIDKDGSLYRKVSTKNGNRKKPKETYD